jgi:PIN domain nuclease of toxin-antitoxin system
MRRLLLDTHALLWWLDDDPRLGPKAREMIRDGRNAAYVSAVTAWEISIKKALGKLGAPEGLGAIVEDEGFVELPITFFHGERAGALPPVHQDPFDRMLVAQAQAEGLEILTADPAISRYGVQVIRANV